MKDKALFSQHSGIAETKLRESLDDAMKNEAES
jgi:hypothetical protein